MVVIDKSTPTLKRSIPKINMTAPIRNAIRILGGIGAIVKHNNKTIASIGKTAFKVSFNFSFIIDLLKCNIPNALPNIFF